MVNHDKLKEIKLKEPTHIPNSVKMATLKFGLYACITFVLLNINNSGNMDDKLKLYAWNMNCVISTAGSCLNVLMEGLDIIALSEHGLYNCELYNFNYVNEDVMSMAKSGANLNDEQFGVRRGHVVFHRSLNTPRPRRNGHHFPDNIVKSIFFNENAWISNTISLKFVSKGTINSIPALIQIMTWCRYGDKLNLNQWWPRVKKKLLYWVLWR